MRDSASTPLGRRIHANNAAAQIAFAYDPSGQSLSEQQAPGGQASLLKHTYDPLGNRIGTKLSFSKVTSRPFSAMNHVVVIPVLNQLHYTQQCVQSLITGGTPAQALLVIDNGSTDDTPAWLASRADLPSIRNRVNLGCGGAWTQGAVGTQADWVVLLNNDILACPAAMSSMLDAADRHGLDVVSPGLFEGPLDYDFTATAAAFRTAMSGRVRRGWFHGVCFAVRRRVFETIGFPDTDRQLGGREDVEYLVRCLRHGVPVGTLGDAVLHHFGSITQKAIKLETGLTDLGDRDHFYSKLGMNWLARKRFKSERRTLARGWAAEERAKLGFVMHMQRTNGAWVDVDYL